MHLVDPVTHERAVLEDQFGSQRVHQFHAHPLSGLSLLHHLYLTSDARILNGTPSGGRISCTRHPRVPNRFSACLPSPCASFEWIVA